MKMDKKIDIPYIAKLARLRIQDDELPKFEHDMRAIIDMVDGLPDASGMQCPEQVTPIELRADIPEAGKYSTKELLRSAPEVKSECIVVPKTVE